MSKLMHGYSTPRQDATEVGPRMPRRPELKATSDNPSAAAGDGQTARAPYLDSRFMRACRREAVDATPVWLMRQAGRYQKEYRALRARMPFLDLCKDPERVAEVTISATRTIGADAAIIFADLLLIAEPLGFELTYEKGEGPVLRPPLRRAADVDRLKEVKPLDSLNYLMRAIRLTRQELDPALPLIGFAGAPFTLASYLIEGGASRSFRHTKAFMYREPGAWGVLMSHLARNLAGYVNAQVEAGVQAVQIFDTWVGCLGPADYHEFVLPYSQEMIQGIRRAVPVIHFGVGTGMLLELMREAGGDVIGLDANVELDQAWSRLGANVGVQGNLDPVILYAGQNLIRSRVQRILDQANGRPGHIFNLGHGILPDTPAQHVIDLVKMVHEQSTRRCS
ncbi:MAG: uroporphyrinogen decarboxylase [Terriglobia bacterium]